MQDSNTYTARCLHVTTLVSSDKAPSTSFKDVGTWQPHEGLTASLFSAASDFFLYSLWPFLITLFAR